MDKIKTVATVTIALALVGILFYIVRLHRKAESVMQRIERIESLLPNTDKFRQEIKERATEPLKKRIDDLVKPR